MNFGEKLTNLRKQKGLSQEELGYQLNVTRQTVSKWELGQTTPEMDKLVEMSKIFGVTLDELTSETETINNVTEKIEDRAINDKPQNSSTWKVILLIIGIFLIAGIIMYTVVFSKIFNLGKDVVDKVTNEASSIINQATDINNQANGIIDNISGQIEEQLNGNNKEEFNQMKDQVLGMVNETAEDIEETKDQIEIQQEKFKIDAFNSGFEMYSGTKTGFHVKVLIDEVITNNKKEKDKIITVIYEGENITDIEELKDIKRNFEDFTDYEVSFEYDENGYIYQAEIEEF